jgi:hypothetical protein
MHIITQSEQGIANLSDKFDSGRKGKQFTRKAHRTTREHEKRKQLEANSERKKDVDAQRRQHLEWLKPLFKLSKKELETARNEIQKQLDEVLKKA